MSQNLSQGAIILLFGSHIMPVRSNDVYQECDSFTFAFTLKYFLYELLHSSTGSCIQSYHKTTNCAIHSLLEVAVVW